MKNKNIVRDKNKKTPFYKDKRGILALILILLMFLLTAVTMPMSQVPILGRMGSIFGLTDESMRALTLSDFAAYSFGVEGGGRLASVRNAQYSVYESSGGLSPFGKQSADRLLDAKRAYLKEFEKTGKWNSINGSASGYDIEDPEGVGVGASYFGNAVAPNIDTYTNAAASEAYGKPFLNNGQERALEDAYADSSITQTDGTGKMVLRGSDRSKMIMPKGSGGSLKSARSDPDTMYFQALDSKSKKMKAGRLGSMGGFNARVTRVGTSLGAGGRMTAFGGTGGEMGRVYYLSASARSQKYNDVAKNIVEAAFDGGEVEAEDMIAVDEQEEKVVSSLEPPSSVIEKANTASGACAAARKAYDDSLKQQGKEFRRMKNELLSDEYLYNKYPPPSCYSSVFTGDIVEARNEWNNYIPKLVSQCETVRATAESYASQCGMNYKQKSGAGCDNLSGLLLEDNGKSFWGKLGHWLAFKWIKQCKNEVKLKGYGEKTPESALEKVKEVIDEVASGAGIDEKNPTNENFF